MGKTGNHIKYFYQLCIQEVFIVTYVNSVKIVKINDMIKFNRNKVAVVCW